MNKKTPSVLIGALTLLLVLFAGSASAQTPPFTNTTIVNGNGTPAANGAALLGAVAAAVPPALIKVEPGTFDLSGSQLVMRNLVDVEGSGRDVTFIVSDTSVSVTNATVRVPPNVTAELRGLTVGHKSNGTGTGIDIASDLFLLTGVNVETQDEGNSVGVSASSNTVMSEVFVRAVSGTQATGFRLQGGGPILRTSFAFVSGPSDQNTGVQVTNNTQATMDLVNVIASFGSRNVAVAVDSEAFADLRNVRGTALGGSGAIGLMLSKGARADVKESTFKSLNDSFSVAFFLEGEARAKATESTFDADPITLDHLNVFAVRLIEATNLDSNHSTYDGTSFAAQNLGTGQARFGASQLIGSVFGSAFTSFQCVFAYRGNYTARNAQCL